MVQGKEPGHFRPDGALHSDGGRIRRRRRRLGIIQLNGELMQLSTTSNLIFTPGDIIKFVTRTMTLEPGDSRYPTGTPGGVGVFRDPPVFLKDGDTIEVIVDGIGTLSNPVVAQASLEK